MKRYLAPLIILLAALLHGNIASAQDKSCNYTVGQTTTATGFANCDVELSELYKRACAVAATVSGTNTIALTFSPAIGTTPTAGQCIIFTAVATSTGTVTITTDGGSGINAANSAGSNLGTGDITSGQTYQASYISSKWRVTGGTSAGGGGGAPTTASYVTMSNSGSLSAERVLTAGTGLGLTDGGADGNATIAVTDVELTSILGLTSAADRLPYYTGSGTAALATFTSTGRSIVDDASVSAVWATITGDEFAQDAVGTILTDGTFIDFTYDDATPTITATIIAGSITATELGVDSVSASELNATGVESELEAVLDLSDLQGSLTLAGDVDGAHDSNDLDEVAVRDELEAVLRLPQMQGQLTAANIGTDAVGSDEIAADAVGTSEIAADAVGSSEIAANAVGNSEMGDNAIGNAEMADNAIGNAEMQDDAVGLAEIQDNSVGNAEMRDNAIGSAEIINDSIAVADLDSVDVPGDEECATYEGGAIEWQACGSGGLADADYGDITVSGTGTVLTIDNDVISLAKMADDAVGLDELDLITGDTASNGDCLLARPAGSGGTLEFGACPGSGGGISNVEEDTSPTLGGNLDLGGFDITGTGNVNVTGDLQASDDVIVGDDLTFASAAVINWNASDVTLTHSANLLTLAGGDIAIPDDAYDSGWNGDLTVPTKNAIFDGLAAGFQPLDTDLTSWAGVTRDANFDAFVATPSSANFAALITNETGTGLVVLQTSPALVTPDLGTPSALTLTNATGLPIAGLVASTSTALGVGSIELGHASNTTIGRPGAGDISVEGNIVYRAGGTDVPLADGGTGASLSDPNADRLMFWDDSAGATAYLTPAAPLTITTTTIDCDASTTSADGCVELATTAEAAAQTDTARAVTPQGLAFKPESLCVAASDETTNLTTGTAKVTFRMPYAFTVTDIRGSLSTVATGASLLTVDVNEGGTTILSTRLTFDASESTTTTAATPRVISDSSLADDAQMTIDIDQIGNTTPGRGLKVCLIGHQ